MSNILSLAFKGIKTPNTIFFQGLHFFPVHFPPTSNTSNHIRSDGKGFRVSDMVYWCNGTLYAGNNELVGNMIFPVFVKEWETYPGVIETILGHCKGISGDLTYHVMDIDIHSNVK